LEVCIVCHLPPGVVIAPTGRTRVLAGIDSRNAERFEPERLVDRLLGDDGE
jgi:hypothetical protein